MFEISKHKNLRENIIWYEISDILNSSNKMGLNIYLREPKMKLTQNEEYKQQWNNNKVVICVAWLIPYLLPILKSWIQIRKPNYPKKKKTHTHTHQGQL